MNRGETPLSQHDLSVLADANAAVKRGLAAMKTRSPADAARWFARATRLVPKDAHVSLLHVQALAGVDPSAAIPVAQALAQHHPAWLAAHILLIAVLHDSGDTAGAAASLAMCLQTMVCPADAKFAALASRVAAANASPGWLGLGRNAEIFAAGATRVTVDGRVLRGSKSIGFGLPPDCHDASTLRAEKAGQSFLGSPIDIQAVRRLRGAIAEAADGAIAGWVGASSEAACVPGVDIFDATTSLHLLRVEAAGEGRTPHTRCFQIDPHALPRWRSLRVFAVDRGSPAPQDLHATSPRSRELSGSPILRGAHAAAAAASAFAVRIAPPPGAPPPGGAPATLGSARPALCVVAGTTAWRDAAASPEKTLVALAGQPFHWCGPGKAAPIGVTIVPCADETDFAGRVNLCLRVAGAPPETPRDIVLLRPGTILAPGALVRLAAIAAQHPDAATISSLHDGTGPGGLARPGFDDAALRETVAALGDMALYLPAPDGPCIFIRHAALAETGLLREGVFGETTGAFADFAGRAAARGWRHLAACGVMAACGRDDGENSDFDAEWLRPARRAADEILWTRGRRRCAIILVTHAEGGGIERHIAARAAAAKQAGLRAILLRPLLDSVAVSEPGAPGLPDLVYKLPDEIGLLAELLRGDGPTHVEFHHAASHQESIQSLPAQLGVPHDVMVHDYAAICPRVTLCGGAGKYCGEPADIRDCQDCIADHGARLPDVTDVAAWRTRSASLIADARILAAPSEDAARRIVRHFSGARTAVRPWDDDADANACAPHHPSRRSPGSLHVAVLGALTQEKGFGVLLACARDAARRRLKLHFTLVGHSIGDARLLETGHVFVTGLFAEGHGPGLLRETAADIALLPSLWPETWSYALSDLWRAGLWVLAFDLGAPAARIRAAGGGTLLPPGLPAARLNDSILGLLFRDSARTAAPMEVDVRRHV